MKHLNELTLKEWKQFTELITDPDPDIFSIFELLGEDARNMNFDKFEKKWREIQNMTLSTKGVKREYIINGRRFKACLNPLKLKAGQFIDFQSYIASNKYTTEQVLSIFLLPREKSGLFGTYKTKSYNTGYDIFEVQEFLNNNMLVGEANELSNFFLTLSVDLLRVMKDYSAKKSLKMRKKVLKNKLK